MKIPLQLLYILYRIVVIVKGGFGMTAFGPGFAEMCIVLMLVLTMAGIFLVTIRSFSPGRFKPPGDENNDFHIEA